ncbi:proton-conducting transporter transmembrane domain-containing protein [Sphingobacterium daejeonense]|uniref:proton-conducting transporter transmembrane domain-containing protein n=1 Tax=Sphingobacterium daejeonense TaxID=371142 RepID=UPI0010C5093A|nr:proton-conducting transporter membrane subunit [Sphingobacterium daejeonense]VTP89418.1 Multiple resistance and pH homeostasis protein A [Sphingobacterium daejeonense]
MLFTILLGLISSILLIPFGKRFKSSWSILLPLVPTVLFCYYLGYIPKIANGLNYMQEINWVPSLGVNFDLKLDGLSLLFCLLITGIGTGIFFYARTYLKGHPYYDRFFGYLYLFMSAMIGLVLSDNIFLLFIFWELTSISSFFLIGFNNDQEASRKSAMTALTITGMGGFFLLAGLVLMGNVAGTFRISELIEYRNVILEHPQYPLILGLLFFRCFYKIGPIPFSFLVTRSNESSHASFSLPAFSNHGKGRNLSIG